MDKQTFYAEMTERLLNVGVSREYVDRHLAQFDNYFDGKNDEEVAAEIAKLGDLDKVAARIKRMTEKVINDAKEDTEAVTSDEMHASDIVNRNEDEIKGESELFSSFADDDVTVFDKISDDEQPADGSDENVRIEAHGTKRVEMVQIDDGSSITSAPIDPEVIERNRRKFWTLFVIALPITLAVVAGTAFGFALMFFALAIVILISIGALIFVTAAGTLVSVFGLIFGVSQMLTNVPIGLYECGVAIMIGAFALAIGILVYNFAVRFMPVVAKWLLKFGHYVIRKYREIYVNLKKECIGL